MLNVERVVGVVVEPLGVVGVDGAEEVGKTSGVFERFGIVEDGGEKSVAIVAVFRDDSGGARGACACECACKCACE